MGTRTSSDVRGTRGRGDPERRFRLRLVALLVAAMTLAFGAGAWAVFHNVRGEMLGTAAADAAATLSMHLSGSVDGVPRAPALNDALAWSALLERYGRMPGVLEMRALDASGTVRWSLSGLGVGRSGPLTGRSLRRVLGGRRVAALGRGSGLGPGETPAGASLDVVLPVAFSSGAGTQRGAVEIVSDGSSLVASLHRTGIEIGAIALLLIASVATLMLHLANLLTIRSFRDRLTGLHNLRHFETTADTVLPRLSRHGRSAAVVIVDPSRLGSVNDALGHRAGDALLRLAADVLRTELRPGDVLARIGGQFLALLDEADAIGAEAFAKRIAAALERNVHLGSGPVRLRATAGIAVFPRDGVDLDELLAHADTALREAKKVGLPFFAYRTGLARSTAEALALESDLAAALVKGELVFYGQPVVHMGSGAVAGVEALARWQHPQRGLLAPGAFIPQAEAAGLIRELDRWAFDAAAATVARWAQTGFAGFLSVNLSAQSLADRALPDAARLALERHGAPPERLLVEVTETAAIHDLQGSRNVLEGLKELGLRVALDDFGTGYSSLAYLRRLPVDLIKIDRQFTEHVARQRSDQHLVRALLTYTRGLGLGVVAEGIETGEQHAWLERAGIHLGQGYLYGRPAPLAEPPPASLAVPGATVPGVTAPRSTSGRK